MSEPYAKPLPAIDDKNRGYWEGTRARELRLLKCRGCGDMRHQPLPACPECGATEADWVATSGRGTVWSFGVFHQVYFKGFADEVPYNVAIVALDEGPRIYTNLVGVDRADIVIGMKVEAVFEDATDEVTLVKFQPAR